MNKEEEREKNGAIRSEWGELYIYIVNKGWIGGRKENMRQPPHAGRSCQPGLAFSS